MVKTKSEPMHTPNYEDDDDYSFFFCFVLYFASHLIYVSNLVGMLYPRGYFIE